ncbi:MAG TPA: hypothetical protein VM659_17465 [Dongiaceae bacterium]|nr:hypothetical protein [Dongiaceae bacterium]
MISRRSKFWKETVFRSLLISVSLIVALHSNAPAQSLSDSPTGNEELFNAISRYRGSDEALQQKVLDDLNHQTTGDSTAIAKYLIANKFYPFACQLTAGDCFFLEVPRTLVNTRQVQVSLIPDHDRTDIKVTVKTVGN